MSERALTAEQTETFVRVLTRAEPKVYAYIRAMVSNWADAEEILQETNAALWRKAAESLSADSFEAWACGVARLEVLRFRQQKQHQTGFSEQFLEAVSAAALDDHEQFDVRREALQGCLEKLSDGDRELIRLRYFNGEEGPTSIKQLAERVGRPTEGMYKAMRRIRIALFECIERRVAAEERP
ncbi:MAG: sigma-70 family RNA polymerase sigma factor [Pirellulales bacterium]